MKYIVVLIDGAADDRIEELENKTPLMFANMPTVRKLEKKSEIGLVKTVPDGLYPGSDIANLSVMGYDPKKYHTGRSPLEALSIGVEMKEDDIAIRMNLVTLSDDEIFNEKIMIDYSGGEVSTEESEELVEALINAFKEEKDYTIYHGISYRHVFIWHEGSLKITLIPPHNITGEKIAAYLPEGRNSEFFINFIKKGYEILRDHPVNQKRISEGKNPANCPWLWGEGKKPLLDKFEDLYGLKGGVISAVDLIRGIGKGAGMEVIIVPGATGTIHTNFKGKGEAAVLALNSGLDYMYIHLEAPDECGHQGDIEGKVRALELIDEFIISKLVSDIKADYRLLVVPDHRTPLKTGKHDSLPVPYMLYDSRKDLGMGISYNEEDALKGNYLDTAIKLHDLLIEKKA
ncbi:MAG: 2 3-bisphosphoglycerate-independent phosphoglycerate mutase [Fusobacteria bacterium]|nr:MAG: 2 3-bisphosphoglycerate-independent phosphoglycerate mutase [Fusobacteriota bacterium]KAF0228885.1 MAG: 2 3-bisphosphoglycerate-independent phosphoglycerate [Fusobacteriota bacterium]